MLDISPRRWMELRRRYALTLPVQCPYCPFPVMPGSRWDLDHEIPLVLGGRSVVGNLRPAHASCNRTEGRRLLSGIIDGQHRRGLMIARREW
jgi:5-methylcytosine-specific restriction endonuclease McrA